MIVAMQRFPKVFSRALSFVLACLVLVWAGAACAENAYESAAELVELVQVDQVTQGGLGLDVPIPFRLPPLHLAAAAAQLIPFVSRQCAGS